MIHTPDLTIAHMDSLNGHYKRITNEYDYPIYIGKEFWHRLTGDENFYSDLIHAIGEVAVESDFSKELEDVINNLSESPEVSILAK